LLRVGANFSNLAPATGFVFYERWASNFDHTVSTKPHAKLAAVRRGNMLSPRFLRMQAEKSLRSALAATDLDTAADLKKMARDL
jgi:hypothetical protein